MAQMVSYMPHFLSDVVVCSIVLLFLSRSNGVINNVIEALGGSRQAFINIPEYFSTIYVWSGLWQGIGWSSILYLSALSSVLAELCESAKLDGANRLQIIRYVNIPAIMPTKATDPNHIGKDYVPFLSIGKNDKAYFWASLGYVGTNLDNWGTSPAIKNGEIYMPCYTQDYKKFVEIWHTMYEEGLMSQDYYKEWVALAPIKADPDVKVYASLNTNYQANVAYVSDSAEHKDRIAKIMDYCFSAEGYSKYTYGPVKVSGSRIRRCMLALCSDWYGCS